MAFQIVEFQVDDQGQEKKKVIPEAFETREQAVGEIEALIALRGEGGYDKENNQWWANDPRGYRYRFLVEGS